ncbi:MAG TPA: DUF917 domain-containing protein [Anaerolineales bacterium]|jgi:DUF917 family protein|nr:DUF917 domain-containing protein [Anaerolineales bacterium]
MRMLTEQNVFDLALGAAVLGTGGGGDPYIGRLLAIEAIRKYGPVRLLALDEIGDDQLVVPAAMMGAPTVMVEKIPNGREIVAAFKALAGYLGQPIVAVMSIEAGGLNSIMPISVAAEMGLPLVDCDGMGRAFPEIQMVTHTIFGVSATPMAMADEKGNAALINTIDNHWTERFSRSITVDMGGSALIALYAATGKQLKQLAVRGTMTYAEGIGKTVRLARQQETNPVEAVRRVTGGFEAFKGKVVDLQRRTVGGFARGEAHLDGLDEYNSSKMVIQFQNEHLVAMRDGQYAVTVPDLITVLDVDTGEPITTEGLRYGFRVVVIGIPCDSRWRTPKGLELVGPRYFGYDVDYVPVEQRLG